MFPEAGEKLGPYEILGELGGGGMARVYRAWDGRLHREVAIKVIDDRFAMPGIGERFLREARAASGLNHPNICTIFDIGEQDGAPYLVMELLEGETLRERINREPLSVEEILRFGAEIADALAAAHARGIVHRDVKPANIFLVKKPNGSAQSKVLDFGLAKIEQYASEERDFASNLTSMGATVGTVSYMSPEQARGEKLDARSDLFSLGIVIYEMATGQLPFQGNTSALVFVQLLGQMAPEHVRNLNGNIPPDLDQLIMKLLAKNPRARFQSATELCDELHELAEKRSGWLSRLKTPPPVEASAPKVREPLVRPPYSPRIVDAARPKPPAEVPNPPSDEIDRALPARPGDPQGVRAPGRRRKDSAEHKSQQKKVFTRNENRGDGSSGQVPAAPGPGGDSPSGMRPMRTSIATNPKITYPAAAPYQSGLYRAAGGKDAGTPNPEGRPAERPAQTGPGASGFSAMRPVVRDPKPSGVRAAARSQFVADADEDEKVAPSTSADGTNWKWILLAIALLILFAGLLAWRFGWIGGAAPMQGGVLLLTHLRNATGDSTLDVALMQGLEIDLLESRVIEVRGPVLYGVQYRKAGISGDAAPERMREIAGRLGATRYLAGDIKGSDGAGAAPFTISVNVMDVASDRQFAHIEETVADRSLLLDAVDRVAAQVRSAMGESGSSIAAVSVPLRAEGSASFDALYAYFQGQEALQQGRITDARESFEKAVAADGHFALAHIQLAVIDREQFSELRAAAEAEAAASVTGVSDRVKLLALFRKQLDAEGDLDSGLKTIQSFEELYPQDSSGPEGMAEVLRMQGRFAESLQSAEKAYAQNPFDVEVYWQAEESMLCVNRFDSVGQIEATLQTAGMPSGPDALLAYYLADKGGELSRKLAEANNSPADPALLARIGFVFDDSGRLGEGEAIWRRPPTANTNGNPNTVADSSKAAFLAQGALNRALAGECKQADGLLREAMAAPHGEVATFDAGVAAAFCGDGPAAAASLTEIQKRLPASTAAREFMVPDLKAAIALKAGNTSAALSDLKASGTYDLVSLTPYLRGLAHEASNQPGLAIADFEIELAHRGALAAEGNTVYPMAQFHIARAYAGSGDNASSAAAYRTFADLWKSADPNQRLLVEARAHAR